MAKRSNTGERNPRTWGREGPSGVARGDLSRDQKADEGHSGGAVGGEREPSTALTIRAQCLSPEEPDGETTLRGAGTWGQEAMPA